MIENVIKRDGTIEPFDAEKITRWAEWASPHAQMKRVWPSVVVKVVSRFDGDLTSSKLQEALIEGFLELETDSAYLTAGALYAAHHRKTLYGEQIPTLWEVHERMRDDNLIRNMGYSKEDYAILNAALKHERDFYVRHYSLLHIRNKYSIKNRVTGKEYETQQFVYMRMAMAIYEHDPEGNQRLADVIAQYEVFSKKKLSAPTPNYVNFATYLRSYASCCLYVYGDTGESLAAAEHITYMMTLASAGLGFNLMTRSITDPVRGGLISHQGKLPYLRSAGANSKANLQNGRGGAGNAYVTIFDPEVIKIMQLRDVRSTDQNQNRDLHYSIIFNNFYWKCLAENRDIFTWNIHTAPKLHELFYKDSSEEFEKEYNRLEADDTFVKKYVDIRYLHRVYNNAESNNGVVYRLNINEANRHTPLNEPIYSSNLCMEIMEHTKPYESVVDLYKEEDHGRGEVALCNLAAVNIAEIESDEDYEEVMYRAYKMIDYAILRTQYILPHVGYTAKKRMYAAVGLMNLAYVMAQNHYSYSTEEGRQFMHEVAERHTYFAIQASLRISRERGLAPWIDRTKWVDGWTPMKTYNRNLDKIQKFEYRYDWDAVSEQIKQNGGLAHSLLVAHMPGEASSKALGAANCIYPVRDLILTKTDNNIVTRWSAPGGDDPLVRYESAWEMEERDQIIMYAIFNKWSDQGASADRWRIADNDTTFKSSEVIENDLLAASLGVRSFYYLNTNTSNNVDINKVRRLVDDGSDDEVCESCTM